MQNRARPYLIIQVFALARMANGGSVLEQRPGWSRRQAPKCASPRTLLALGIISTPSEHGRRGYIREWLRAANGRSSALLFRFVIGGWQLPPQQQRDLDEEHARHLDLAVDVDQQEGKDSLTEKTLKWFVLASRMFPCAQFVGKTDPDTFIRWEGLKAQLRAVLTNRVALGLGPKLYVSMRFDWTFMLRDIPHACGCCGIFPNHARKLRAQAIASNWLACDFKNRSVENSDWSELHRSRIEGPFPFAPGAFFAVSRWALQELAQLAFVSHALQQLRHRRWDARMLYTEDMVFGWVMAQVRDLAAVSFGGMDAFDNFDTPEGPARAYRKAEGCFMRYGLSATNFTTGHYSEWGSCCAEYVSPRQVVVHHVKDEAQWRRAAVLSRRWDALPRDACFATPLERQPRNEPWFSASITTKPGSGDAVDTVEVVSRDCNAKCRRKVASLEVWMSRLPQSQLLPGVAVKCVGPLAWADLDYGPVVTRCAGATAAHRHVVVVAAAHSGSVRALAVVV